MEVPTDISQVIESDPAVVDNSKLSVTPTDELKYTGMQPDIDMEQYRLSVNGLVDNPISLTYEELLRYQTVTQVVLMICPGFFADNAEWTGVPVHDLLEEARIDPDATAVIISEVGGSYRKELLLKDIMANDGIFLAHTVNGEILPEKHGFPLRLVAKGKYGYDWVKWVDNIEVK
jgi:sulfoxide reductase catalytic subunit YedY